MSAHEVSQQQLIDEFQEKVDRISPAEVHPLDDFSGQINHNGKYIRVDENLGKGMYLGTERNAIDNIEGFHFQLQPGSRMGREDSHNQVFFGRLWTIPKEGPEHHAQVAVKPIPVERQDSMLGELAAFQYLGKLALPSFKPAGVLINPGETGHLLTHFDGPVSTMDTVEWRSLTPEEAWGEIRFAVDTLVLLHSNMLFHCDLYFRNIGFNERGETMIVDPELMVSARDAFDDLKNAGMVLEAPQEVSLQRIVKLMRQDFSKVFDSTEKSILRLTLKKDRPRNGNARLKIYKHYILEPYRRELSDIKSPTGETLRRAYDNMLAETKKLAAKDII